MENVKFNKKLYNTAQQIVDGCMGEESPACQASCPMHTDIKTYVRQAGEGNYKDALLTVREKVFLPQTLGRICAHPCEKSCRRNQEFSQPISVAGIKRFVAEQEDKSELWDLTTAEETGKHIAIVGAGPAGAQAALDLRKQGHHVTVFDRLNAYGGMMRVGIPEYRLPYDVMDFEFSYLDMLGVKTCFGVEVGKDISFQDLREQHDAVILAHGAHVGTIIPVPGHEAEGVFSAVEFLREISETRSFPRAGKRVMVIGGGDVAMDCARSSLRIGIDTVYQCSLEDVDHLPASEEEAYDADEEGVHFNQGWGPKEVLSEGGRVTGIIIQKVLSIFDDEGRFAPSYGDETRTIEVDALVFATGQKVADITDGELQQGPGGRYVVDKNTMATSVSGVFVAGDACGSAIVVEAMALGRKAAISVERHLSGKALDDDRNFEEEYSYTSRLDVPLPKDVENIPRLHPIQRDPNERKHDFSQVDRGYTAGQVAKEARRCMQCSCKKCMDECVMMNDFGDSPKGIFSEFIEKQSMDPLLAYSCNACDQCTIACPKDFPMKDIFMGARADFVKANNGNSPIKGHKAINMHQKLSFSRLFSMADKG